MKISRKFSVVETYNIASKYMAEYPLIATMTKTDKIPNAASNGLIASSSITTTLFVFILFAPTIKRMYSTVERTNSSKKVSKVVRK